MKLKKSINEIAEIFQNFGTFVGLSKILDKFLYKLKRYNSVLFNIKHYCIKKFLKIKYKFFINEFKNKKVDETKVATLQNYIWIFWWQDIEDAPEIVKKCFNKIKLYNLNVKLITKNNYKEYVSIPEYIIELLENGKITLTHFSDILRFNLLADYGGLWLDATIYISDERIINEILKKDFYTIKLKNCPRRIVSKGLWTGYCMGGNKNNLLFLFMKNFFNEYWKNNSILIDYFLIDYMISIGYDEISDIKNQIDKNEFNNEGVNLLMENINNIYDEKKYEKITRNNPIQKLSYKRNIVKEGNTFYNYL